MCFCLMENVRFSIFLRDAMDSAEILLLSFIAVVEEKYESFDEKVILLQNLCSRMIINGAGIYRRHRHSLLRF